MATAELALCVAGIYACFISWGVLQERVSTTPYYPADWWQFSSALLQSQQQQSQQQQQQLQPRFFTHFVFLNFVQAACASVVAFFYVRVVHGGSLLNSDMPDAASPAQRLRLMRSYLTVALLGSVASPFGYAALQHVDYLTMMLAKSCKLLPVMLMSFVLHRRRFAWFKYASVALITAGVAAFVVMAAAKPSKKATPAANGSTVWGLVLLAANLLIDGATNASQDHLFRHYRVSGPQLMFFMNALSAALMLLYLSAVTPVLGALPEVVVAATGLGAGQGLAEAVWFCLECPAAAWDILLFGMCGAIGQVFIFHTLQRFGSLVLVTVNVTRKMMSMLVSVLWFGHQLAAGQWLGVAMVFSGIGLEAQMSRAAVATLSAPPKSKTAPVTEEAVDIGAATVGGRSGAVKRVKQSRKGTA